MKSIRHILILAGCLIAVCAPAHAQDTLKVVIGQRGNWDTAVAELGQNAGIFRRHGLVLKIHTQGTGETIQAAASGSADVSVAAGTAGALGAFSRGAPIRAIGSTFTGSSDLFYYVRSESPVKSLSQAGGSAPARSSRGAPATNSIRAPR